MAPLSQVAQAIDADERTLRRAVAVGTVRCRQESPRKRTIAPTEVSYLIDHWVLLSQLRHTLRTEPNVRLAVLYGSAARGDDRVDSDVDVLVSLAEDRPNAGVKLAVRLELALARDVDIARLNRVEQSASLLLLQALDEGRVIVDRDHEWPELQARRAAVADRARRDHAEQCAQAAAALRQLLED